MRIVGGLDIHRQQVTFDWVDLDTGEAKRGRITPADRVGFRKRLGELHGEVEVVLEGCTGWRFIAEECAAAGVKVQVADPAEVAARRSSKRRAKTDRIDARQLPQLLGTVRFPSRGSRRRWCSRSVSGFGCIWICSRTSRLGSIGSTPRCSSMGAQGRGQAADRWPGRAWP